MKSRSHLMWVTCILVAAVALSGCGNKGSVGSSAKSGAAAQSKQPGSAPKSSSGDSNASSPIGQPGAGGLLGSLSGDSSANPFGNLSKPESAKPGAPVKPLPPNVRPEAKQLFAVLQSAYRSARSLKVSGTSSMTMKQDGKVVMHQAGVKISTTYKAPGKFIMDSPEGMTMCDGKNVCLYSRVAKRYRKSPFTKDVARMIAYSKPGVGVMGLVFGMDYTDGIESYKLLPDAKVSGQDTFVLALKFKKGAGGASDTAISQTLWIGKRDLAIYKNEIVSVTKPRAPKGYTGKIPKLIEARMVDVVNSVDVNPKVSDAAFVFKAPSGAKAVETPKPVNIIGKPAPDFAFTWTDGSKKKLSDFRGKPVVLVFWAMPMPEAEVKALKDVCERHKDDATVIAINFNGAQDKLRDYLKSKKCDFPFVAGTEEIGQVAVAKYGMRGIPSVVLIDSSGSVRDAAIGVREAKDMDAKLKVYASAK